MSVYPKLSYAITKGWGLHFSLATGLYYTKDSPKQVHSHGRGEAVLWKLEDSRLGL